MIDFSGYTDRIDLTPEISLYEYGFIRNPTTNKTLICPLPINDCFNMEETPEIREEEIRFEDVKAELESMPEGFWQFIDEYRTEALARLNNDYLTDYIFSMNQWDGRFTT